MGDEKVQKILSTKARAWPIFDHIVASALDEDGQYSNPWVVDEGGAHRYEPDYAVLESLLGVPLYLTAATTTGVPALALDVWLAYELRRAGFAPDAVWPRATHPRILPGPLSLLLESLPRSESKKLRERLEKAGNVRGVTAASASILGKNYNKQVDVIISDWSTGPELLISTKRMDSSYGKNAPNRVEESYGDAKNLRLRHPLAALGFVFGLRNDVFEKEPDTAAWLLDLLAKLGREEDAYHATCVVLMEYGADAGSVPDAEVGEASISVPGVRDEVDVGSESADLDAPDDRSPQFNSSLEMMVEVGLLPPVRIDRDRTPEELSPARFLATIVSQVIDATPVNMHVEARRRRREARTA